MAEVGLEGWVRLGILCREEELWGGAAESNMSKHVEPRKQDVCGKENRLFTTAASHITVGTISIDCKRQNDIKVLKW